MLRPCFTASPEGRKTLTTEPYAGLVRTPMGISTVHLWRRNRYGGNGCGTAFKVDTSGTETVLHGFSGTTDGCNPFAGVILDGER